MFLNQLDHEKAQKAPLFLDLAILLLASQKSDEAASKETSEMMPREVVKTYRIVGPQGKYEENSENSVIRPFLSNFKEKDISKIKNIGFNTFQNKTGFQFNEEKIMINFGSNGSSEYIKTQTWSKMKETASKLIAQNGQKKEIKEIVINKLVSEDLDILEANPQKMREIILEIPSVQEEILIGTANELIKYYDETAYAGTLAKLMGIKAPLKGIPLLAAGAAMAMAGSQTESSTDSNIQNSKEEKEALSEKDKKIMIFELMRLVAHNGELDELGKKIIQAIAQQFALEKEYFDELATVAAKLSSIQKEAEELINE